jgi:hypothetical protein
LEQQQRRYEPTFPKWAAVCAQDRLILPVKQAFFALSGVCDLWLGRWRTLEAATNNPIVTP